MSNCQIKVAHLAALALLGGATAFAIPQSAPVYTFCERECNDSCEYPQYIHAGDARDCLTQQSAADCFYITGKLQADCVWDIEPKCALRVFNKPQPARTSTGAPISGQWCEPVIASSDNFGWIHNVAPIDGAVRLGVAAFQDAFDGTINGLNNNALHGEFGEVTIKVYYNWPDGETNTVRSEECPDDYYVFQFHGNDALRVSFIIPSGVPTVDIQCCDDTGTVEVCYDVDFYHISGLVPLEAYAVQVIGGLDKDCNKTDTVIGIYNKNCFQIAFDDDGGQGGYSEVVTYAELDGTMVVAVSGKGDADFNGLLDSSQDSYFLFLTTLRIRQQVPSGTHFVPGASVCCYGSHQRDECCNYEDVIRYSRAVWDDTRYTNWFSHGNPPESRVDHGICGGYCLKISRANHVPVSPGGGGSVMTPSRVDINGDLRIDASDLALMLSFWGPVDR